MCWVAFGWFSRLVWEKPLGKYGPMVAERFQVVEWVLLNLRRLYAIEQVTSHVVELCETKTNNC